MSKNKKRSTLLRNRRDYSVREASSKVVDKRKVIGRTLLLIYNSDDGWIVKFKGEPKPLARFYNREQEARQYFNSLGGSSQGGDNVVVNLMAARKNRIAKMLLAVDEDTVDYVVDKPRVSSPNDIDAKSAGWVSPDGKVYTLLWSQEHSEFISRYVIPGCFASAKCVNGAIRGGWIRWFGGSSGRSVGHKGSSILNVNCKKDSVGVFLKVLRKSTYPFETVVYEDYSGSGKEFDFDSFLRRGLSAKPSYQNENVKNLQPSQWYQMRAGNRIASIAKRVAMAYQDEGFVGDFWGSAGSGMLFTTGQKILLMKRANVEESGTWGIAGGAIPVDDKTGESMDIKQSALNEVKEEMGRVPSFKVVGRTVYRKGSFTYTTFVARVEEEFTPRLNWESSDSGWFNQDELSTIPLHFGVKFTLKKAKVFDG